VLASHDRRFLFIHVQKTGGTTVTDVLKAVPDVRRPDGCPKHAGLRIALRHNPELADHWIFGFVRNPWARYVSWWEMIQRAKASGDSSGWSRRMMRNKFIGGAAKYPDFDTFVERGPEDFSRLSRSQITYLSTRTRRADYIGRTETFADDIRAVLAHLDLPVPEELPHRNKSEYGSYREYYSPATRDRIGELFKADVDAFGYDF
jgi:hypothetical protein